MKKVISFGEVMLRLSTSGYRRFQQSQNLEASFGGGELNVAVSLANYGIPTNFISRIPENEIADWCIAELRKLNIGVEDILRGGDRMGIYFLEPGAVYRPSKVVYDRAYSSMATIQAGMINWKSIFKDAQWFHWTGITPAISNGAAEACMEAIEIANKMGLTVSVDLNYRSKLWKYGNKVSEVMTRLVEKCDIIVGNEEDAEKIFDIKAEGFSATHSGEELNSKSFETVCIGLKKKFPKAQKVIISLRGSINANHNHWKGCLYSDRLYESTKYDISHIVDRVGSGDSFMGGLIYSLITNPQDPQRALDFAVAASCLKHTIYGDFNLVTRAEVEQLMQGDRSGRVSR